MSIQPLRQEDVDLEFIVDNYNSLKISDIGQFKAKRIFQISEEYFNTYPDNINVSYIYSKLLFIFGKKEESIKIFKDKVNSIANINLPFNYLESHTKLAMLYYFNKKYTECLNIILKLEKINEKKSYIKFLALSIPMYFENHLYDNMFQNIELYFKISKFEPLLGTIYLLFYYYHTNNYDLLMNKAYSISKFFQIDNLNINNIEYFFEEIKKELILNLEKPEPTELEIEFLENIKKVVLMYISYKPEEISFDENITFNNQNYKLHVERCEEGGFFGEIKEIDGCYTQGKTLDELKENILEVLEMYTEEDLITV